MQADVNVPAGAYVVDGEWAVSGCAGSPVNEFKRVPHFGSCHRHLPQMGVHIEDRGKPVPARTSLGEGELNSNAPQSPTVDGCEKVDHFPGDVSQGIAR